MALVWFLPDLKIMMTIAKHFNQINKCLAAIDGAQQLAEGTSANYWTANEASATNAFVVKMNPFNIFAGSKRISSVKVRPVRYMW